jgi:hypothetical protein
MSRFTASVNAGSEASPSPAMARSTSWKPPILALEIAKEGRPKIDRGLRDLTRRMSRENPKWGASRIHGELLMLGFEVAQGDIISHIWLSPCYSFEH